MIDFDDERFANPKPMEIINEPESKANSCHGGSGGETRAQMIALNRKNPAAVDERFLGLKPALETATRDRKAL